MANKKNNNAKGDGNIRKRSDGRWEGRYTLGIDPVTGKQIQKSVYGATQKEVRLKLREITSQIDEGTYLEPCNMKLGVWLDTWLKEYTGNVKPATYAAYEQHVRVHIKPALGNVALSKLTPPMIQKMYNDLQRERGLSPKSIKNIHGVMHRALEQARKLSYIKDNPVNGLITPRVEKKPLKTMDNTELVSFLKEIRGAHFEIEMFVAAFTGLRQSELLGLTWDCVDFEKHTLLINKQHNRVKGDTEFRFHSLKNDQIRTITVADEIMEVIQHQKTRQEGWAQLLGGEWNNWENLVFTTETGRYIHNKTLYMHYKRIVRKLGMDELRFHDLRHAYAVNSLRAGDDIKTVQENLGHATASFTLSTYAHATQGMKQESANRMEKFLQGLQEQM